jgi:hypothetical protein
MMMTDTDLCWLKQTVTPNFVSPDLVLFTASKWIYAGLLLLFLHQGVMYLLITFGLLIQWLRCYGFFYIELIC